MESKLPVFVSIVLIFLPLLLFAGNTDIYLVISFVILFVISLDNVFYMVRYPNNRELTDEYEKLKAEFENTAALNLKKLELGFKTAKAIFIATFVISVLIIIDVDLIITVLSAAVIFLSVVEIKNYRSNRIKLFTFLSGITNIIYLAGIAFLRFIN